VTNRQTTMHIRPRLTAGKRRSWLKKCDAHLPPISVCSWLKRATIASARSARYYVAIQPEDMPLRLSVVAGLAVILPVVEAGAQAGQLTGRVVDSAGLPVAGAELAISGSAGSVTSSDKGEFRIFGLARGHYLLRARRIGFRPDSIAFEMTNAGVSGLSLTMRRAAQSLSPVVVSSQRMNFTGRLAGYYERLDRRSGGYFITRAQIDAENPRTLSQLLQHAPGMTPFRGRAGTQGVRMRGRRCWPLVFLDGTPMPSGDVDLDGIPPNTLHGIELYLGSTTAPARYSINRDNNSCGTILLWSRGPDTDPIRQRGGRKNLEAMVANLLVYTADQVDSPAVVAPGRPLQVNYPPALFAEKLAGTAVAEFVVGPDGRMEDETFGVVSSSHPLFTEAVKQALEAGMFRAAIKDGRSVRQLVHLPIRFSPPE
jgi:TonB family protein